MKHLNDLRALPDSRSDALYRTGPNVPNCEDSFSAGLEASPNLTEIRTRQYEALAVESNT